eukprot:4579558-Pyramimonas_sp.AAC.1
MRRCPRAQVARVPLTRPKPAVLHPVHVAGVHSADWSTWLWYTLRGPPSTSRGGKEGAMRGQTLALGGSAE